MRSYTESSPACAINQLVSEFTYDLKLDVEIDSDTEGLEANVKDSLYLIVREAVTNVKLHAMATRAMVTIDTFPDRIHLFVQDDGRGFCLGDITKEQEGLMRMQKRHRGRWHGSLGLVRTANLGGYSYPILFDKKPASQE